jgi:hypothetical protein
VKGQQEALNPRIEELHEKIGGLQARSDAEKAALSAQLSLRTNRVALLETVQADFFRARLGLRFDRSIPHGACVGVCVRLVAQPPTLHASLPLLRLSSWVAHRSCHAVDRPVWAKNDSFQSPCLKAIRP